MLFVTKIRDWEIASPLSSHYSLFPLGIIKQTHMKQSIYLKEFKLASEELGLGMLS